eukprot:459609_1
MHHSLHNLLLINKSNIVHNAHQCHHIQLLVLNGIIIHGLSSIYVLLIVIVAIEIQLYYDNNNMNISSNGININNNKINISLNDNNNNVNDVFNVFSFAELELQLFVVNNNQNIILNDINVAHLNILLFDPILKYLKYFVLYKSGEVGILYGVTYELINASTNDYYCLSSSISSTSTTTTISEQELYPIEGAIE